MYNINILSKGKGPWKSDVKLQIQDKPMTDDEKLELDYYRILASKSMKAKVADLIAHHKHTRKQPRKPKK